jgi:D-aspartate ligase
MLECRRPAVVFGLLHAGLALVRGLGRRGVPVHGMTFHDTEFGLRSRYLVSRRCFDGDGEAARDAALLAALRAVAEASGERLVLFPERDENVAFVLDNWEAVTAVADVPLPPDPDVTRSLRRKERLVEVAEAAGVPAPRTVLATGEQAIRGAGLRPPFLLKPVEGQEFALTFGHKAIVAETMDDAVAAWQQAHEAGFETLVQELIPDSHERIFSLLTYIGRDGRPLGSLVGRKVRQGPLHFGTSAYFAAEQDDRVLDQGLRLLLHAGYRGFAHVEFAYDVRDDTYKLLEVNTRPPVWYGIAATPAFDLTAIAYDDLCGRPAGESAVCTDDLCWAYLAKDVAVSLQMARRGELRVGEVFGGYARRKIRATWASDDIFPAVASVRYLLSRVT